MSPRKTPTLAQSIALLMDKQDYFTPEQRRTLHKAAKDLAAGDDDQITDEVLDTLLDMIDQL